MKLINPAPIKGAALTSSNVLETVPAWSVARTDYAKGERVLDANHVWEWLSDAKSNTAVKPSADTSSPPKWFDTGASNRWKMFDKKAGNTWMIGTATTNAETIDVTVTPGQVVNSIALFGLDASSVQVIMKVGDRELLNNTITQDRKGVNSWYEYYFTPIDRAETMVLTGLPAYGTATFRIVVKNPGATARVGLLTMGRLVEVGESVYGTSISIQSYSTTTVDQFGNETIISRGSRRIVDYDVRVPTEELSRVTRLLDQLRDTVCVYIGTEDLEASITVGRFENLRINISNPSYCEATAEVRSLN